MVLSQLNKLIERKVLPLIAACFRQSKRTSLDLPTDFGKLKMSDPKNLTDFFAQQKQRKKPTKAGAAKATPAAAA